MLWCDGRRGSRGGTWFGAVLGRVLVCAAEGWMIVDGVRLEGIGPEE